jgi:hypothetical protein
MSARRSAAFLCGVIFVASAVSGSDRGAGSAITDDAANRGPFLHPLLSERVSAVLSSGIPVALRRLQDHRSCQALFQRLGADGAATLRNTSYYPAGAKQESRYCARTTYAVTEVGGSAVVVCRSFARLSSGEAAIILIHEGLHAAGQTEYPTDPRAPSASDITQKVMKSCQLF